MESQTEQDAPPFPNMPDGNIVISAPLSDGTLRYHRVHKSTLAHFSRVFADMFTLPDDAGSGNFVNDTHDGVPLVHLPDNAQDVTKFLQAIYDFSLVMETLLSNEDETLALWPVLKLAQKYRCDRLQKSITSSIKKEWPQSLVEWEVKESRAAVYRDRVVSSFLDPIIVDEQFPEPASAIRLGRDFDILEMLPAAFYELTRIDVRMDRDRAENVWSAPHSPSSSYYEDQLYAGKRTARWGLLDQTDLVCLMRGKARLEDIACHSDIFDKLFRTAGKYCRAVETCREATEEVKNTMITDARRGTLRSEPSDLLETIRSIRIDESKLEDLCMTCQDELMEESQMMCETLWKLLPDLFFKEEHMRLIEYPFDSSAHQSWQ